jgi:hypothetical protein
MVPIRANRIRSLEITHDGAHSGQTVERPVENGGRDGRVVARDHLTGRRAVCTVVVRHPEGRPP